MILKFRDFKDELRVEVKVPEDTMRVLSALAKEGKDAGTMFKKTLTGFAHPYTDAEIRVHVTWLLEEDVDLQFVTVAIVTRLDGKREHLVGAPPTAREMAALLL